MIVLTFVFIFLISFPALSLEPSKKFNRTIPFDSIREIHQNAHPKNGKSMDFQDLRILYPPIDERRQFLFLAKNYRKGYKKLSPEEKEMLKKRYQEWESMPEERQEVLRRRMKKWKQLSPAERQVLQQRFQQWQKLSPEERKRTREKLQEWDRLAPGEKDQILQKFREP